MRESREVRDRTGKLKNELTQDRRRVAFKTKFERDSEFNILLCE